MAPRSKRASTSADSNAKRSKTDAIDHSSSSIKPFDIEAIQTYFLHKSNDKLQYTNIYQQQQQLLKTLDINETNNKILRQLYRYRTADVLNQYYRHNNAPGQLYSFGSGDMAQLGLGTDENMRERKKPTPIKSLQSAHIVTVTAGALHNACLTDNGAIYTWGCNDDNALGRTGTEADDEAEWLPQPVDGVLGKGYTNTTYEFDKYDDEEQQRVVQIAAGASHTIALTSSGRVYTFGTYRDANGVLGFTDTLETAKTPYYLQELSEQHEIVQIAAGEHHDLALTTTGEVYQWGDVGIGQRISGRRKLNKLTPTKVSFSHIRPTPYIIAIYAGGHSSFAIDTQYNVYAWGPNNYGQCGVVISDKMKKSGDYILHQPVKINTSQCGEIIQIASNIHHTLLLNKQGKVYALGRTEYGRLGIGDVDTTTTQHIDQPVEVHVVNKLPNTAHIVDIACGEGHSIFVTSTGELNTCGSGELCQLGLSEEEDTLIPTLVTGKQLEGTVVLQSRGGSQHTVVLAAASDKSPYKTASNGA